MMKKKEKKKRERGGEGPASAWLRKHTIRKRAGEEGDKDEEENRRRKMEGKGKGGTCMSVAMAFCSECNAQ